VLWELFIFSAIDWPDSLFAAPLFAVCAAELARERLRDVEQGRGLQLELRQLRGEVRSLRCAREQTAAQGALRLLQMSTAHGLHARFGSEGSDRRAEEIERIEHTRARGCRRAWRVDPLPGRIGERDQVRGQVAAVDR